MLRRRQFLTGLGGITVALPFLGPMRASRLFAQSAERYPTRMITVTYPMGTDTLHWVPSATGASFTLPETTSPLTPFIDRCLFVSECDQKKHQLASPHRAGHPGKEATTLTNTLTTDSMTSTVNHVDNVTGSGDAEGLATGPSVEELVGRFLKTSAHPHPSINLAVNGNATTRPREQQTSLFFYESASNPVTLVADVRRAFNDLFAGLSDDPDAEIDPAVQALHERNRSVLDAVRASFVDLRQGLGAADRAVLDDHMDKIRQLELEVMRVTCGQPPGVVVEGTTMGDLAPLMNRIAAAAMGCSLAPIARIEYTSQQDPEFGIPMLADYLVSRGLDWHGLVHEKDNHEPARLAGFRFFVEHFAGLLAELDAIPEGPDGESVLDHSLVLLATNFGEGDGHRGYGLNFVLAGNLGPAKTGFHYSARRTSYGVDELINSILPMVGVTNSDGSPRTWFGLEGFGNTPIAELFT